MRTRLIVAVLAASALAGVAFAQPPGGKGPGGGGRGMMGSMMYVEQSWTALCFEVNLSAAQIAKLKPSYAWAYKTRNTALKTAREKRDFQSAAKTLDYVKSTLDARIPNVLTAAQKTAWKRWQTEQAAMHSRMRPGGAGGKAGTQGSRSK
ncbi:hypothetical protein LLH23_02480 [bacterium]|nr:hypothetical protein [bacterium]